jgi:hypothetical protein
MKLLRLLPCFLALSVYGGGGADSTPPTVSITEPGRSVSSSSIPISVMVKGLAGDPETGLNRVEVKLNGVMVPGVMLTPGGYEVTVTPRGGSNVIEAQAFNSNGLGSAVARKSFTYIFKKALEVNIAPQAHYGKVKGLLAGEAYRVGSSYSLTAVANPGFIFDHWSGLGLAGPSTEFAKLVFTYTDALAVSELVPGFTAHFMVNPFTPALIGDFSGLVEEDGNAEASNSTDGLIKLKVTAVGTFTGYIYIDGFRLKIAGSFDNTGVARFGPGRSTILLVPRLNKPAYELSLTMDLSGATDRINGTLRQKFRSTLVSNSLILARRSAGTVDAAYLNRTTHGFYTVVLPASAPGGGLSVADFPQGTGAGSLRLSRKGGVTFTATLADGTKLTASGSVNKDRIVALHAALYVAKAGCLGGEMTFDGSLLSSDVSGDFFWFRPWQNVEHYPWGWPSGLELTATGAKYNVVPGTNVLPDLMAGSPNADLTFSSGALASPLVDAITISPTYRISGLATGGTLKIVPSTGAISGSFLHSDGTKPKFVGVIVQRGSAKGASGFFLTTKPKVITGLGLSGLVELQAQ